MQPREICRTLILVMITLSTSCARQKNPTASTGQSIDISKLKPACFAGGETPLIDNTVPDPGWTWNDPHVLKVDGKYWMYASSTDNFTYPVKLYRLTSSDDTRYARNPAAPILEPGTSGSWDAGGIETPAVVYFQGQYHLF